MSKSALASITAQYTDSENEEEIADESAESENSQASQVIIPQKPTPLQTPEKTKSPKESKKTKKRSKAVRRLVSYQDDTVISDEEGDVDESTVSSDETDSEEDSQDSAALTTEKHAEQKNDEEVEPMDVDIESNDTGGKETQILMKSELSAKYANYNFGLPPAPKGKPSAELVDKIKGFYEKMEKTNVDMNRAIQERKEFRNPSIYEKLIQFCDINELGTNYPPEIYDPLKWGAESYYEELARVQKNEMVKRQKDRKEMDKIEQATALARKVEEEAKKRKSKWDQPAATKSGVQQPLTTTVTGTKGTVISAFGNLPKKPAA